MTEHVPPDRELVAEPPRGAQRVRWIGPGIIWMISAIATGELLFTPRIASLYGYDVLWMMLAALLLKALLAREIGRYAVVTGGSLLHGIRTLPGPAQWGVWFIVAPQLVVAVTTITGMAGATGSALILAAPGDFRVWSAAFLAVSIALVLLGRYRGVEWASIGMSAIITAALFAAAAVVFPGTRPVVSGLTPGIPAHADMGEILPWLGFMMSGAAGLVWYSYWLAARGYGAAHSTRSEEAAPISLEQVSGPERERLRGWIGVMSGATAVAAGLVLLLLTALLILGAELLRPAGLLPEGPEVTAVLGELLGRIWGDWGRALMIVGAFFAFWSTIIANLDGWRRMLGQGSIFIARQAGLRAWATSMVFYRYVYVIGLMGVLPAALFLIHPEPYRFLQIAGVIEAIHIPFVAFAVLYLNRRRLPQELRPSVLVTVLTAGAALFFLSFAGLFLYLRLAP